MGCSRKPEFMTVSGRNWYAVATRPRMEGAARENLERQGYGVCLPELRLRKRRQGRWQDVNEPLFPGYLFVALDLAVDNTAPIRSTVGVRGLVRFGLRSPPMPAGSVEMFLGNTRGRRRGPLAFCCRRFLAHSGGGPLRGLRRCTRCGAERSGCRCCWRCWGGSMWWEWGLMMLRCDFPACEALPVCLPPAPATIRSRLPGPEPAVG